MASKYWIKLYHEILDDPKMGRLPDRIWRRIIELFLMAGDADRDGELPSAGDIAWRLRITDEELTEDLDAIEALGIIRRDGDAIIVTHFSDRQSAMSGAERVRRYRDSKQTEEYYGNDDVTLQATESVTNGVTNRYADIDIDIDKDKDSANLFTDILARWAELFPTRPHPTERNKALRAKAETRCRDPDFREQWDAALVRMTHAGAFASDGTWFTLNWFLENDGNWRKCADGNYDDKRNGNGKIRVTV